MQMRIKLHIILVIAKANDNKIVIIELEVYNFF